MEYSNPGFISQLRGKPTKQNYRAATIFLDHYSDITYVKLQRIFIRKKLQAKKAFKAYKRTEKVNIKHYHTENCRFADNPFLQAVAQENQTISYCGVNSHFQNGKYKRRIRDIQ